MATHLEIPRTQWTRKQAAWRSLEDQERAMRRRHLRTLFADDAERSTAIAKRYRDHRSEFSDRARSGHYYSKEV